MGVTSVLQPWQARGCNSGTPLIARETRDQCSKVTMMGTSTEQDKEREYHSPDLDEEEDEALVRNETNLRVEEHNVSLSVSIALSPRGVWFCCIGFCLLLSLVIPVILYRHHRYHTLMVPARTSTSSISFERT